MLDLVKLALWDTPVNEDRLKVLTLEEWRKLFETAQKQGLAAIVVDGLQKLDCRNWACRPLMKGWGVKTILSSEMRWLRQLETARKMSEMYQRHGIRTLLLKGLGLSQYYPNPKHREGNDIDVYLFGRYAEGNQLAQEELGAKVEVFNKKEDHILIGGLSVDNHIHFVWPSTMKEQAFDNYLKKLLEDSELEHLADTELLIPPPEFNYLFLLHHSYSHFMREGMPLRQLTDMALFLQHVGDAIPWEKVKTSLERFGMRAFSDMMLSFIATRFSINVPKHQLVNEKLLARIEADIFDECHVVVYHDSAMAHKWYTVKTIWKNRWKYREFYPGGYVGLIKNKLFVNIIRK